VPHLDWVFVNFWLQRHGVGSLLLDHVARALRSRGLRYLASTFQIDNPSSVQWHWRSGFRLQPSGWSAAQVQEEELK
jgi:L-amino acid N-acyltransferase YncA